MTEWIKCIDRLPKDGERVLVYEISELTGDHTIHIEYLYHEDEDDSQFEDGKGVTHWMPLPEPPKDEQKEDVISKVTREIMDKHHEIIDDWGKAYMAQIYQEKGSIKPGDFVLYQQEIVEHGNPLSKIPSFKGYKYWFSLKDDQ